MLSSKFFSLFLRFSFLFILSSVKCKTTKNNKDISHSLYSTLVNHNCSLFANALELTGYLDGIEELYETSGEKVTVFAPIDTLGLSIIFNSLTLRDEREREKDNGELYFPRLSNCIENHLVVSDLDYDSIESILASKNILTEQDLRNGNIYLNSTVLLSPDPIYFEGGVIFQIKGTMGPKRPTIQELFEEILKKLCIL